MILKELINIKQKMILEKFVTPPIFFSSKKIFPLFAINDKNNNLTVAKTMNFPNQLPEDKYFFFLNRLKADSIITTVC